MMTMIIAVQDKEAAAVIRSQMRTAAADQGVRDVVVKARNQVAAVKAVVLHQLKEQVIRQSLHRLNAAAKNNMTY
jgi:hypothetical protein